MLPYAVTGSQVKSLQFTYWLATTEWNPQVCDLQTSCTDLTPWFGTGLVVPVLWGNNRFLVIREMKAKHKIGVKSWFAIPVMITKFPLFTCEFVKNAILNRDVDTIFFVISFSGLYLGIYDTKSWNRPFNGMKTWHAPYISRENVNWAPLLSPKSTVSHYSGVFSVNMTGRIPRHL